MSEIAIISARDTFLSQKSKTGIPSAKIAQELKNHPNTFLPSIQVGITTVGIFMGAFSGKTIAFHLQFFFQRYPIPYPDIVAIVFVVIVISYISLVLGELVPKRIALNKANDVALFVAKPIKFTTLIASPFIYFLGYSTDAVLSILKMKEKTTPPITEEEISSTIDLGRKAGLVEADEQKMATRIFEFGDRQAHSIMTPRTDVIRINSTDSEERIQKIITDFSFGYYPVLTAKDHVSGVINAKDILMYLWVKKSLPDLQEHLVSPIYISEHTPILTVVELFRKSPVHFAIVVDEYGGFSGIITPYDLLQAIVGELPVRSITPTPSIHQINSTQFIVDGALPIQEFKVFFKIDELPEEQRYGTVSGFILMQLEHIPGPGETFVWNGFEFKVTEVQNYRISKIQIQIAARES